MVDLLFAEDNATLCSNLARCAPLPTRTAGTGKLLSVAEERILERNPKPGCGCTARKSTTSPNAICKSDMLVKGQDPLTSGSATPSPTTSSGDRTFDYCTSNPPFGYSWLGRGGGRERTMVPGPASPMAFRASATAPCCSCATWSTRCAPHEGGGRAGIVLNGSPLFTGAAESGPSKIRQWLLESDLVEAIIASDQHVLQHRYRHLHLDPRQHQAPGAAGQDPAHRRLLVSGRNCGRTSAPRAGRSTLPPDRILAIYDDFEDADPDLSKVLTANDFAYWTITVERPLLDDAGNPVVDRRGRRSRTPRRDTENVPFTYGGNVAGDAVATRPSRLTSPPRSCCTSPMRGSTRRRRRWATRFRSPALLVRPARPLAEIDADLEKQVAKIMELLQEVEKVTWRERRIADLAELVNGHPFESADFADEGRYRSFAFATS